MRRYAFIYNPRSGDGRRGGLLHAAGERLRANGREVLEYQCEGDPREKVEAALRDGCEAIVACGGDGTVNAVANALRTAEPKRSAVLGVLPLGTLNHFAKDLGIHGMDAAEQVLMAGRVQEVDAGMVNGRLFVNNSGIGIYPMMVLERDKVRKTGLPKWPAFLIACAKITLKLPFQRLHLEADGMHLAQSTPFLFVGNNVYSRGATLGRRERLDEGVLEVCMARRVGAMALIRIATRAVLGTVRQDRDFRALTAKELIVRRNRKRPLHVSVDGEVCRMRPPLEYSIAPRALRVLAP